jgi:hypothetical protein
VADEELLGEIVDRHARALGACAQDEERLVVLRRQATLFRLRFRKAKKLTQRAPEGGELLVLLRAQLGHVSQRAYRRSTHA